jgi:hypothetical protein
MKSRRRGYGESGVLHMHVVQHMHERCLALMCFAPKLGLPCIARAPSFLDGSEPLCVRGDQITPSLRFHVTTLLAAKFDS